MHPSVSEASASAHAPRGKASYSLDAAEVLAPEERQATDLARVPFGSLPGDALRAAAADLLQLAARRVLCRLPATSAVALAQHLVARAEEADGERSR